jgi:hypothetical protein
VFGEAVYDEDEQTDPKDRENGRDEFISCGLVSHP